MLIQAREGGGLWGRLLLVGGGASSGVAGLSGEGHGNGKGGAGTTATGTGGLRGPTRLLWTLHFTRPAGGMGRGTS